MQRLEGKNVRITGASSGIGQAIAIRFARDGANVAINYRSGAEQAEATQVLAKAARLHGGGREIIVQADVSSEEQVKAMIAQTVEAFGRLDVLINNAGIQKPGASHEIETHDFDRVLAVNLRGPFLCSRDAIRHFLSRPGGGVILNNSSVHEIIPKPKYLSYSISKGGMENLTKSMALEYADRGIRVNAVGPGAVVTPINKAWINDPKARAERGTRVNALAREPGVTPTKKAWTNAPKARAEVESHIPMGRAADPAEIA